MEVTTCRPSGDPEGKSFRYLKARGAQVVDSTCLSHLFRVPFILLRARQPHTLA